MAFRSNCSSLCVLGALLVVPACLSSQQLASGEQVSLASALPDAPQPLADGIQSSTQAAPTQAPSSQSSSSAQAPAPDADADRQKRAQAEEQLKAQEKQRVMGVMATFNTTQNQNALPLSPGQKFRLFFRSETDPWPFMLAAVVSGIGQADDSYPEWHQGLKGYGRRFAGAYSDAFIGNFFGNAVLPVLLKEDPRYYQKGTGSAKKRFLWAAASTVWCKRDNGRWGPNYANVGGNLIGSAIARIYYPASERTVSDTITDGLTVSAEGIVGAEVIEFWPDMVRRHNRKKAEKLAREAAQSASQSAAPEAPTK
ncbi:MAG: hypothetical protein ABSF17_03670 [Terracidiphilus sp.]